MIRQFGASACVAVSRLLRVPTHCKASFPPVKLHALQMSCSWLSTGKRNVCHISSCTSWEGCRRLAFGASGINIFPGTSKYEQELVESSAFYIAWWIAKLLCFNILGKTSVKENPLHVVLNASRSLCSREKVLFHKWRLKEPLTFITQVTLNCELSSWNKTKYQTLLFFFE